MARVSLHFEDKDGEIFFRSDYQGGFDAGSPAHKLANQVIKFLDDQATKKVDLAIAAEDAENIEDIRRMASAGEPLI